MSMRTITDTLHHPDGEPWVGAKVTFRLAPGSYTAAIAYPTDKVILTTDETGAYSVSLWCDEEGIIATQYSVTYPGSAAFEIDLPVGDLSPVAMSSLRTTEASQVTTAANLQELVDAALVIGAGVASVNGATGVVVLLAEDVDADPSGTAAGLVGTEATARATADSDHAALTTAAHGGLFTQAAADALYRPIGYVPSWAQISGKPTTIAGLGITDPLAYTNAANVFSAAQTITGAALGITITGAAAAGTPSIVTTAPTQAVGATAGTPLAITASAAIAGSATVGAAAGGDVTITAGAAARLTSGNANGGNITLTPGAGIGTGTAGQILIPTNAAAGVSAPSIAFSGNTNTGIYSAATHRITFVTAGTARAEIYTTGFAVTNTSIIGWSSTASAAGVLADTALARSAAAVVEVNTGTVGQWAALKLGTRDTSTGAVTNGLTLGHQISTGTPGSGMGAGILFNLNSSTTPDQNAAQIAALWPDAAGATHATRSSAVSVSTVSIAGALAERLRVDAGVVAGAAVSTTIGLMVWDVDGAALKRVSVGANDSGGAGYKLLRISN